MKFNIEMQNNTHWNFKKIFLLLHIYWPSPAGTIRVMDVSCFHFQSLFSCAFDIWYMFSSQRGFYVKQNMKEKTIQLHNFYLREPNKIKEVSVFRWYFVPL